MQYSQLIARIQADIYNNGAQLITGDILQGDLLAIISALASAGACYGGIITPDSSAPASLDHATFYIAIQPGTYSSFGVTVTEPSIVSYGGGSTLTFTVSPLGLAPAPTVVKLNTGDKPYVLVPLTGTDGMSFTVDIEGGYSGGSTEVYAQRWLVNYSTDNGVTIYVTGDKVSTGMIAWARVYESDGGYFLVLNVNTSDLDYVTMAFRNMTGDPVPGVASVASIADYTYSSDAVIIETEFQNNKVISIGPSSSNIQYPSAKAVYEALSGKQDTINTVNVSVSATTGTPSGTASVSGSTMNLSFSGIKGEKGDTGATGPQGPQGNTGSSVDYPFELVDNLTTDDATKALSAAQGVVLKEEISQLSQEVKDAYQENNEISVGGTMSGQANVSNNRFYPSSTNYVNNYYPVVAHKECSIDVTATRTIATIGFIYFFAGSLPPTSGGSDITEIFEPLVSGTYNIKYTPDSDGYIFVLTSVSGSACCSGLTVKQQGDFIDFQSEIDTANQRISLNEAKTEVLDEKVGELSAFTNESDNYDAVVYAYINANNGRFNAQDPSTNRFVRIYRARAGEKIRIYGNISGGTNIYTFLAKSTKATIPVTGDTVQVLVAYPDPDIDQVIDVTEDCWYLIGFIRAEANEAGKTWGFYRDEAIAIKDSFALPNKIRAVVGDTIQVFKKSIFRGIDVETVDITTKCAVGRDFPRYFEYLPVSGDVGTKDFRILMKNYAGQIYDDKTCPLIVHATPTNPSSMKRIAIFGDSLTQGGQFPVEVARRLLSSDAATATMPAGNGLTNIKFIGGMGDGNARYFGVGGWSWKNYATAGNPAFRFQVTGVTSIVKGAVYSNNGFQYTVMENNTTGGVGNILCSTSATTNVPSTSGTLTKVSGSGDATITFTSAAADQQNPLWDADNEAVSFSRYLSNIGEDTVDCVVFLLGWNDMSPDKKDFSTMQGYMEAVINALHEQYPSAIVKILGLQLPSLNGGLGTNYGANGGYADKFGIIKAVFNYNDFLQGFADGEDYSPFVEFVDVASQFDSENNMPDAGVQVNTRNSKTEFRGTNGVHPANPGYMQIADVLYRAIVHEYC